jgi:DNA-directed RNA polymerase specialized sigma24 family protein
VALRFACELSYAEIAAVAGGSEAAARRNVHVGLKRLREEMTR